MCYLRLYVKGRGRGVQSKSAIFNNVVFFAVVFEPTPPRGFVRSAEKFFSTLRTCNLRKAVLFATLRQRAWPWRSVKVSSVVFFSKVCEQTPPREFISSALKSVSTVRIRCKTNVVLFATLRQRACPWRVVKVGHFESNVKV